MDYIDPSSPSTQLPALGTRQEQDLGTEALCHAARRILEPLYLLTQVPHPQKQVFELHTQARLFGEACHDLEEESLRRRRDPRSSLALSTADQLHLHGLLDSVDVVGKSCYARVVGPLQDRLEKIVEPHLSSSEVEKRYKLPHPELDWYAHISRELRTQTNTLKVLSAALGLVYYKNDVNSNGDLSSAAYEAAKTLQSRLSTLALDLESDSLYETRFISVGFAFPSGKREAELPPRLQI